MTHYLYCITNKINNKSYVGQSIDPKERWRKHMWDVKRQTGKTAQSKKFAIHNAIAKYGEYNFEWQIIDQVNTEQESNELEIFYIQYLNTLFPNGYNLTHGGDNHSLTYEARKKISDTLKTTSSLIGKKGKTHPRFGVVPTQAERDNLSKKFSGENGANTKISAIAARTIYVEYLNDEKIFPIRLSEKYNLGINTIRNILKKKSWKEVLKDLPDVNLKQRMAKSKSKLTDQQVLDIRTRYAEGSTTYQELADAYKVSNSAINNIVNHKRRAISYHLP